MTDSITIQIKNDIANLASLAGTIDEFLQARGVAAGDIYAVNLAAEEMAGNVIMHGFGDSLEHMIAITLAVDRKRISMTIEDDGREFDPVAAPAPDVSRPLEERAVGGLGVFLVKQKSESMHYERRAGRNILTIRFART